MSVIACRSSRENYSLACACGVSRRPAQNDGCHRSPKVCGSGIGGTDVRPSTSELRNARKALNNWDLQHLEYDFVVASDASAEISVKRVRYLQSYFKAGQPVREQPAILADVEPNAIGLVAIQLVDVSTAATQTVIEAK
jgi:hypothetical protein